MENPYTTTPNPYRGKALKMSEQKPDTSVKPEPLPDPDKRLSAIENRLKELETGEKNQANLNEGIQARLSDLESNHQTTANLANNTANHVTELRETLSSLPVPTGEGVLPDEFAEILVLLGEKVKALEARIMGQ